MTPTTKRTTKKTIAGAHKAHNAEATKAAILDAAEAEFAKLGLTAAHTEAIASKSGVTKTMIYYYFENKEGLYLAVLERAFIQRFRELEQMQLEQLPPERALQGFLEWFLSEISCYTNLADILMYEAMQNKGKYYQQIGILRLYQTLIAILEQGMACGVFRLLEPQHTAVNIVAVCTFYFAMRENIKHLWSNKKLLSKTMLEQHKQEAIDLVMAGVRA